MIFSSNKKKKKNEAGEEEFEEVTHEWIRLASPNLKLRVNFAHTDKSSPSPSKNLHLKKSDHMLLLLDIGFFVFCLLISRLAF